MGKPPAEIAHAYWLAPRSGCVFLRDNWEAERMPALAFASEPLEVDRVERAPPDFFGRFCGYYDDGAGNIVFCQEAERHPQIDFENNPVQVAGLFNDWGRAGPMESWQLRPCEASGGGILWMCAVPKDRLGPLDRDFRFKFVSSDWHWLKVLFSAPNRRFDEAGNSNYVLEPHQTGRHVFRFSVRGGRGLNGKHVLRLLRHGTASHGVVVTPGLSFYDLKTDAPLGAQVEHKGGFISKSAMTAFRVFAPRASAAEVELFADLKNPRPEVHALQLAEDELTWEVRLPGNLHGSYYYLRIFGENDGISTHFDGSQNLLDPWALATVGATGPGIVVDHVQLPRANTVGEYVTPSWHDLVIVEAHLRDLVAHAPIDLDPIERQGFRGFTKWVETEGSYLRSLGVNALELLPVTQNDAAGRDTYHWGYMTNNYFAPCAYYGTDSARGSQTAEFRELVEACHRHGLAVILDVVYNHVGEPSFLLHIDKDYYFQVDPDGSLTNWSGCGNTFHAESAMARRLIIDSLIHLVEAFGVDGFRFDLAELLTVETLREVEIALKRVKPSVILIAEPWSFRGNIAWRLRSIGFSFWNDGYREFVADYVRGHGNPEGLEYFMKGSIDHLSAWPAQSVNYVESHDDRCWLDKITENADFDGHSPTETDIHRTDLMFAVLMCSIGIPMFAAGQDFLRSKHGLNNTYERGDINALDYERLAQFRGTHEYCKNWIAFRRSDWGTLLRLEHRPTAEYVRRFNAEPGSSAALLFNADGSAGERQILFAINPHHEPAAFTLDGIETAGWRELADRTTFFPVESPVQRFKNQDRRLELGPLDCGLWVRPG